MLIPIDNNDGITVSDAEVEEINFADLNIKENEVEEFFRKNIEVVFDAVAWLAGSC